VLLVIRRHSAICMTFSNEILINADRKAIFRPQKGYTITRRLMLASMFLQPNSPLERLQAILLGWAEGHESAPEMSQSPVNFRHRTLFYNSRLLKPGHGTAYSDTFRFSVTVMPPVL